MKVICIDNKPGIHGHAILLVEGNVYNASQSDHPNSYFIEGLRYDPRNGNAISFKKRRFIPISEIDETELVNQKQETY